MVIPMMENDMGSWHYRGAWFDKLTMRESCDEWASRSATLATIIAANTRPHGELVEPRIMVMPWSGAS
ncbi:hypothetical protein SAMN05443582_102455 [Phyllobacterium sp. OV277]|nr:hypothetical protein SAMN05443582_102455 [Phyllobacterium sp. OV277]